jgi:hypothetical protein
MNALTDSVSPNGDEAGLAALRTALDRYAEPFLRRCASRFGSRRVQDASLDMRERILAAIENPVMIDRTLKTLSPAARRLLRLVGIGRQTRWRVQTLVDIGSILGSRDGVAPIGELLEAALAFPDLADRSGPVRSAEEWLAGASTQPLVVRIALLAAARATREPLELPKVDFDILPAATLEADGLEWPLRLAVAWQLLRGAPLRLTQQGGFFKRDLDRLRAHPILGTPPAEHIGEVPDASLLAIALAEALKLLTREGEQVRAVACDLTAEGNGGELAATIESLWRSLVGLEGWHPLAGWTGERVQFIAAPAILALAILAELPAEQWALVDDVDSALGDGPDADPAVASALLLGLGHQLRLVQAARHKDHWWVRLTPLGRAIAAASALGADLTTPPQTLVVQPNLEIVVYRQGLNPTLIARLSRVAEWRSLGLACTLGLTADSVYRGLESGETLSGLVALLERHGARPLSEIVVNSLRSWASKRERILVFPSAVVLEFRQADDLDRAVRQGLIEHRLTDRIGLIASEAQIDYQQFRLIGARDYLAADELCVDLSPDGLTLSVNEHKSDLLLESELERFAVREGEAPAEPLRARFLMTLESLRNAQTQGLDETSLEAWFRRRAGQPLPPAARLLLTADRAPPFEFAERLILRLPSVELADGLAAWPETAHLVGERLAPTVFAVPSQSADALREALKRLREGEAPAESSE